MGGASNHLGRGSRGQGTSTRRWRRGGCGGPSRWGNSAPLSGADLGLNTFVFWGGVGSATCQLVVLLPL